MTRQRSLHFEHQAVRSIFIAALEGYRFLALTRDVGDGRLVSFEHFCSAYPAFPCTLVVEPGLKSPTPADFIARFSRTACSRHIRPTGRGATTRVLS